MRRSTALGVTLLGLAATAAVAGAGASPPAPARGVIVSVEGRRQHLICEGPPAAPGAPTVVFEAGAFGIGADWAAVQAAIGGRYRSCAYDRAGLGASEPSESPRVSANIAGELRALLAAAGERPPFILVAHSMAPVHAYSFARRFPEETAGLVLVDALPPVALAEPTVQRWVAGFGSFASFAPGAARLGFLRLISGVAGDPIGVPGAAHAEKVSAFGSVRHNRWAAAEAGLWAKSGEAARALGDLDLAVPVAVVTPDAQGQPRWRALQAAPALRSDHGWVVHARGAGHADLLGPRYAPAVVRGIDFVRGVSAKVSETPP